MSDLKEFLEENESALYGLLKLRISKYFKLHDFEYYSCIHRDEAKKFLGELIDMDALHLTSRRYIRFHPALSEALLELEDQFDEWAR